jgi:putative transposase
MPTHVHFIAEQTADNGIHLFFGRILNAYTRYFNLRHNRLGPLWQSRFGNTPIAGPDHLNRAIEYVFMNPVKDGLALSPNAWPYNYLNDDLPHLRGGGGRR